MTFVPHDRINKGTASKGLPSSTSKPAKQTCESVYDTLTGDLTVPWPVIMSPRTQTSPHAFRDCIIGLICSPLSVKAYLTVKGCVSRTSLRTIFSAARYLRTRESVFGSISQATLRSSLNLMGRSRRYLITIRRHWFPILRADSTAAQIS